MSRIVVSRSDFRLDIDLSIQPGETAALLGPSGAGKSTTLEAIAGLVPLTDGSLSLNGRVLDDPGSETLVPSYDRKVGAVFQDYVLFPHLTVEQNVAFGLKSQGAVKGEVEATTAEWLGSMNVDRLANHRPDDLSGGEAQRVALARALITQPHMLLLDEPLSALDVSTRSQLRRVLAAHLEAFAGPRLLITHEPTEAFLLADTVHVIENGSITQVGTPDDIRLRPRTRYAADLAGVNLFRGDASSSGIDLGAISLVVADHDVKGSSLVTVHPRAIAVHRSRPEGSPRNAWQTTVTNIERYGHRVRLQAEDPIDVTAEITEAAEQALDLSIGTRVWLSVKATEIGVEPG